MTKKKMQMSSIGSSRPLLWRASCDYTHCNFHSAQYTYSIVPKLIALIHEFFTGHLVTIGCAPKE